MTPEQSDINLKNGEYDRSPIGTTGNVNYFNNTYSFMSKKIAIAILLIILGTTVLLSLYYKSLLPPSSISINQPIEGNSINQIANGTNITQISENKGEIHIGKQLPKKEHSK